jgi:hypothetical protein
MARPLDVALAAARKLGKSKMPPPAARCRLFMVILACAYEGNVSKDDVEYIYTTYALSRDPKAKFNTLAVQVSKLRTAVRLASYRGIKYADKVRVMQTVMLMCDHSQLYALSTYDAMLDIARQQMKSRVPMTRPAIDRRLARRKQPALQPISLADRRLLVTLLKMRPPTTRVTSLITKLAA